MSTYAAILVLLYLVLSKHIYKFGFVRNKCKENCFTRYCFKWIFSLHKSIIAQEFLYQNVLDIVKFIGSFKISDL